MASLFRFLKKRFNNGFTLIIVPVSKGKLRSFNIPFAIMAIISGIILFNIYIVLGYTVQVGQLFHYYKVIAEQERQIVSLKKENNEVQSVLRENNQVIAKFDKLKKNQDSLNTTWLNIRQKDKRHIIIASRGLNVRSIPIASIKLKKSKNRTSLFELKSNLKQLAGLIDQESKSQQSILTTLIAYEQKLDHTPSIWPVGSFITSRFGKRFHPLFKRWMMHTGIDLHAGFGTPIAAVADGIVKTAAYNGGYGLCIIIDHGYGYQTLYGHNSRNLVYQGQAVKKGQIICCAGASGDATGPHLHYEVRINGEPVNPVPFLNQ